MNRSAAPAARVLQPAAWRRSIVPILVAVLVLSVVLQEPVAALLPAATPRALVFLAIAVPVVAALVVGLGIAYPRILVEADGALRVRGRTVRPSEIVGVRRSVSAGGGAAYLVLMLRTAAGRRIRVLVAGTPIRGLDGEQLRMLREAVAASGIPFRAESASERAFLSESVLASGRGVEADRNLVLRELDQLRGAPYRAPSGDDAPSPDAEVADALVARGRFGAALADDGDAGRALATDARATRLARRIAFWVFVIACVIAAGMLVVLVIMEATGTDFGAADEDPLTAAMSFAILAALVTGVAWAVAADADDSRNRAISLRWLAAASEEQRRRGLPTPFHTAWLRPPGGRMAGLGLLVLGMVALMTVIGGPVALAQGYGPPWVGIVVTIAGAALGALALWLWLRRRRAHSSRVEWLIGVAGEQASGGPAFGDGTTR
ncbi:MAG: hypothetical protein J0H23_13665 [Micrococcales bacterium]|nr:hypothetical protein [Micrococcales bacterium]OJX69048.1 MAG: hypothetical protein BGO94_10750 [Micrococcales bacterium 72-143]